MTPDLIFVTSIPGASKSIQVIGRAKQNVEKYHHIVHFSIKPIGMTKVTDAKIQIQGSITGYGEGPIIPASLDIGTTTQRIANGLFYYQIDGNNKSLAENLAGSVFSASHKIAASKYGAINVYVDAAGTISTKIHDTDQAGTIAYNSADDALQSALSGYFPHPQNTVKIGTLVIQNNGVLWTANTNNLTADVVAVTFFDDASDFVPIDEYDLSTDPDAIDRQKGAFYLTEYKSDFYMRIFVHSITGDGELTVRDFLHWTN
jgi:hypothetical protein